MDTTQKTDTLKNVLRFAYDELSDDDKIQIDLQVKRIMDYYEIKNMAQRAKGLAIFPMSRDGALELLYRIGQFRNMKEVRE